jgi:hypothetical protein
MIIKNKIDNEPVLSNVGQVGEFRIRNSAKAFSILSSGLYANKIRAIIREYSCNAVDSHVEAGHAGTPFDVHLPNSLEPWFAVRDYGVGLDEQQVRNIFTTYFESTKTETDDLIGGLGLGSKSAFSYTDNFTIVAVKNDMKRVYTAFINDQGVPSIAPMGEEASTEPAGVEIRFAVEDSHDFLKFYEEARHVYKHFKLRPVVSGGIGEFSFIDPEYEDRDIIPGVHTIVNFRGYNTRSYAIMGNIEYPLDVPSNMDLGEVGSLLNCGLVIEFGIGELDIQASREGLSYIPETVAAIKSKLEALNAILADKVAADIDTIKNPWEKAYALRTKLHTKLWTAATKRYIVDTKFELIDTNTNRGYDGKSFYFTVTELAEKFNIKITAFYLRGYNNRIVATLSHQNAYDSITGQYIRRWPIKVDKKTQFVENDTTVGAGNRAKYHWKNDKSTGSPGSADYVYVIEKADKKLDMKVKAFFKALSTPPASQIRKASTLMQQERVAGMGKGVTVLKLEKRDNNCHMRSDDMVWRAAGDMTALDNTKTYYYLPMSGFTAQGASKDYDMKTVAKALKDSGIFTETVYGVRKADLEKIKGLSNWVNLDDHVSAQLSQKGALDVKGIIKEAIGFDSCYKFGYVQDKITNSDSPYLKLFNEFAGVTKVDPTALRGFETLCTIYNVTAGNINVTDEVAKYTSEMKKVEERYPLLSELPRYFRNTQAVAEYVNAIDMLKGI